MSADNRVKVQLIWSSSSLGEVWNLRCASCPRQRRRRERLSRFPRWLRLTWSGAVGNCGPEDAAEGCQRRTWATWTWMLTIFYISIFFFRFLRHPKNWESLRMAVVLHLCSNKPASRAQTGSNRVVVWCVRTPECLLLTSWESAGTFCAITLSYLTTLKPCWHSQNETVDIKLIWFEIKCVCIDSACIYKEHRRFLYKEKPNNNNTCVVWGPVGSDFLM